MPANLDHDQQRIIIIVTSFVTFVIISFVCYTRWILVPSLTKQQQRHLLLEQNNNDEDKTKERNKNINQHNAYVPTKTTTKTTTTTIHNNKITYDNNDEIVLWHGILTTFSIMCCMTLIGTYPITLYKINLNNDDHDHGILSSVVTSSINFCEVEYENVTWLAEPANTISSIMSYIPLSMVGFYHCWKDYVVTTTTTSTTKTIPSSSSSSVVQWLLCYTTLLLIGIGSTLLHAFLTAFTQGGDELPMLWYSAITSYCGLDVILLSKLKQNNNNTTTKTTISKSLGIFIFISAIISTIIYIYYRSNFFYFYIMFVLYVLILLISLIYIAIFMQWEKINSSYFSSPYQNIQFQRNIIIPFVQACGFITILASWIWCFEMIGCHYASTNSTITKQQQQQQQTTTMINNNYHVIIHLLWNRILHPCWHFLSALVAFLVIQIFFMTDKYIHGGNKGDPKKNMMMMMNNQQEQQYKIITTTGMPLVIFKDTNTSTNKKQD